MSPVSLTSFEASFPTQPARRPDNRTGSTQVDPYMHSNAAQTHLDNGTSYSSVTAGAASPVPALHQWLPQQAQRPQASGTWGTVKSNSSGMPKVSGPEADNEPWR